MSSVEVVFNTFFSLITDDMYFNLTKEDIEKDCYDLLLCSLPTYEFPETVIDIVTDDSGKLVFSRGLSLEEINILAHGMAIYWVQRQITSIELTRQKYTGQDFKLTSQAAHLSKLLTLQDHLKVEHRRLQMLATRRRKVDGKYASTFDLLVTPMKK